MIFNEHSNLEGQHAFLSASKYHWINYDDVKLEDAYRNHVAAAKGTRLHALAAELIELGVKLPRNGKTFNRYVNDAISFDMQPEQILYFSSNCFGTADSISFKGNVLRIHDLKTGTTPTSMMQLRIYAALFCLEYDVDPRSIDIELRIYQNDEVQVEDANPDDIMHVIDRICESNYLIERIKQGG